MNRLDELLTIIDSEERETALADFARSLGVDPHTARSQYGHFCEERLVLLIYDALKKRQQTRSRNAFLVISGVTASLFGLYLLTLIPKDFFSFFSKTSDSGLPQNEVMKAYTKDKKPVLDEDGQPELFVPMDGPYVEYDEKGNPTYEYEYQHGRLISKKKLGPRGRVIGIEFY